MIIENVEQLKQLAESTYLECYIALNGGAKSSKQITYDKEDDVFEIFNYIDDSHQTVATKDLNKYTNIVEAIEKKAFYSYD